MFGLLRIFYTFSDVLIEALQDLVSPRQDIQERVEYAEKLWNSTNWVDIAKGKVWNSRNLDCRCFLLWSDALNIFINGRQHLNEIWVVFARLGGVLGLYTHQRMREYWHDMVSKSEDYINIFWCGFGGAVKTGLFKADLPLLQWTVTSTTRPFKSIYCFSIPHK